MAAYPLIPPASQAYRAAHQQEILRRGQDKLRPGQVRKIDLILPVAAASLFLICHDRQLGRWQAVHVQSHVSRGVGGE